MPILASHELETLSTHSSPIHMVFNVIDVEGYRARQQSAIVVSEYVPSLKGGGKVIS